jgi:hypothetical protein
MSCTKCDIAQGSGDVQTVENYTFIRVGVANILIAGCDEHLKELIEKLRGK